MPPEPAAAVTAADRPQPGDAARIGTPPHLGSYLPADVTMLLTELSGEGLELPTEVREGLMQGGGHYAETLPIEYEPTAEYEALFERLLTQSARRIAELTTVLAERIVREATAEPVLVSLARAGTPVGVLLRRALLRTGVDAPHYTVSIVRERGLDPRALEYLTQRYAPERLVFIDGWTGKGAIGWELQEALDDHASRHGVRIPARLAVLTDPAHVAELCASRADELIPSACLNSTVSGLLSRTIIRPDLLPEGSFHGVRVYREFAERDRSRHYVDAVAAEFDVLPPVRDLLEGLGALAPADGRGLREVQAVQAEFAIANVHRVKPGIGETTRVLLRRLPQAIVVDPRKADRLDHILLLARDRGVPIVERESDVYACFGLIEDKAQ
ncbi:MAG: cysteine protease StiP domain-containing protein [Solirubrobacteraceae bacterium]|nr:tellurite-like stress resistance cysteine protease StiP [Patulibacter sp.]